MNLKIDRHHVAYQPDRIKDEAYFCDGHPQFSRSDSGKFVENLHADGTAGLQQFVRTIRFRGVARQSIQENVGVKEGVSHAN